MTTTCNSQQPQQAKDPTRHASPPSNHPQPLSPTPQSPKKRPNAFTELMSTKKPKPTAENVEPSSVVARAASILNRQDPRNGLGIYIEHPEQNPEGRVVEYDDEFVVIRDKFPKASVHLLLLPRNPDIYSQHPLHILSTNPEFLSTCLARIQRVKYLAATELRRQFGHMSQQDAPYQEAHHLLMATCTHSEPTSSQISSLPPGRDWAREIVAGIHTHPSMNHLHIHVISRDMHSRFLKHKKHYLSFTTSFLVRMDELPLEAGSVRFRPGDWPGWEMKCWRCGKGFANKFARLKEHLHDEFEEWKKE